MITDRRTLLAAGAGLMAAPGLAHAQDSAARTGRGAFPKGFLWGSATAGHQVEGNNINSDLWVLENVAPTIFAEPSGDAVNAFELWPRDLDLVRQIGLNSFRFSLEWARIEPEAGRFSLAMLDHYKAIIEGCRVRGLTPIVTYNHYTTPRWFAMQGGWTNSASPGLFARFCERATRHLGAAIGYATTLNEPNIAEILLALNLPAPLVEGQRAMLAAGVRATGSARYVAANAVNAEDVPAMLPNLLAGHKAGRLAIKSVRPDLPVGVSLSMFDDQAAESGAPVDAVRARLYGPWLEAVKGDDFLGVQNYERSRIDAQGRRLPPPPGATVNWSGTEVYAPSLAGAVRYAHRATGVPILVSEHGVGTDDDRIRATLIPAALAHLKAAMDDGVPVLGYVHWSLLDNFEWIFGYRPHFGLASVDRTTFQRTLKPSASVLGAIARRNAI